MTIITTIIAVFTTITITVPMAITIYYLLQKNQVTIKQPLVTLLMFPVTQCSRTQQCFKFQAQTQNPTSSSALIHLQHLILSQPEQHDPNKRVKSYALLRAGSSKPLSSLQPLNPLSTNPNPQTPIPKSLTPKPYALKP